MKIGLIGAGRLGICLALLIERAGYDVLVSDIREDYVSNLNKKRINTNEPGVGWYLKQTERFEATTDNQRVINECDIVICLVATPSLDDGSYDVSSVWKVVEDFKSSSAKLSGKTFIVGCTTNPGDCEQFAEQLDSFGIDVFYNPEFIAQGSVIKDLQNADMVLIGGEGKYLEEIKQIYFKIQVNTPKIYTMSTTAAELVKLAVNCYLTTKISYANMVGEVMSLSGMGDEIEDVLSAIGADSRVGSKYLKFGYGYGGPCLPRDNRAFGSFLEKLGGFHPRHNLGYVTDGINGDHGRFLVEYWEEMNTSNTPFYFDYISYKKGTDILTESQQFRLCTDLLEKGHRVYIHDDKQVTNQVYDQMVYQYGDRVRFVDNKDNITEPIFVVNL